MHNLLVTQFVEAMERAGRNGTRAHLSPVVVRHILAHPAWREFLAERQREMVSQWEETQPPTQAVPSVILNGDIAPDLAEEVGLAASRQAFAAVDQIRRRRKRPAR